LANFLSVVVAFVEADWASVRHNSYPLSSMTVCKRSRARKMIREQCVPAISNGVFFFFVAALCFCLPLALRVGKGAALGCVAWPCPRGAPWFRAKCTSSRETYTLSPRHERGTLLPTTKLYTPPMAQAQSSASQTVIVDRGKWAFPLEYFPMWVPGLAAFQLLSSRRRG